MKYEHPEELDFFVRDFGLSVEHDPDEGINSYIYKYDNGRELTFTHSPSGSNSVSTKLVEDGIATFYLYEENVTQIQFQAWENEQIIRVYFGTIGSRELRISYKPVAKLYFAEI